MIRLVTLLLVIVVAVTAQRLPGKTKPSSYELTINDLTGENIKLVATFKAEEKTKEIVLHAGSQIRVEGTDAVKVQYVDKNDKTVTNTVVNVKHDTLADQLKIEVTDELLTKTDYTITITYSTENENEGFYNSAVDKYVGLTQFSTTGARHAFPCWDEPEMKATFKLTVTAATTDYTVLSSVTADADPPLTFGPTPNKMSPHVMSWAIMNTDDVSSIQSNKDARMTIYSIGTAVNCKIALAAAETAVKYLETYLNSNAKKDSPRKITKLDLIATVNTKFPSVNNWGLQVYSEEAILFFEKESTTYDKQRVWQIVTRESTHQWFGDLVTPVWWDEIWLSVGFATYFEYFALAGMQTKWQVDEQFVVQQTQVAFQADCFGDVPNTYVGKRKETHPIIMSDIETTSDIDKVFNNITFNKGASVVRMLNAIMGEESFQKGVRNYLNKGKEKAVDSTYLWTELEPSVPAGKLPTGLKLADAMENWTKQPGFPEIVANRDYNAGKVTLSQSQFLYPPHEAEGTWNVPIFWITENSTSENLHWLQPGVNTSNQINLPSLINQQWLLINKDQAGFYRVNYDTRNWQLLSESLLDLSPSSRAMLLDDALNLARAGRLDYVTALEVTGLLPNETHFAPWSAALTGLGYLHDRLSNDIESRQAIEKYILDKLDYVYEYIGGFSVPTGEAHVLRLMKQLVLHWACRVGHAKCLKEAEDLFNDWDITPSTNKIDPDLRRVTYCVGMQTGGRQVYRGLKDLYGKPATSMPENARIVYALGCANDTELLTDYLESSLVKKEKPTGRQVFTAVCQNPDAVQLAFNFLITHWIKGETIWGPEEVGKAFSEDIAPKLNTAEQLKQLKQLLTYDLHLDIQNGVELAIGTLEDTLVWQENHRKEVIGAIGGNTNPKPGGTASSISVSVFLIFMSFVLFIRL